MKKSSKTPRFEVDFKTRLDQQREATNAVRLTRLGYAPYRVYEIKEKKGIGQKKTLNGFYGHSGHSTGGKSSYLMNVAKSRQSGASQWQQVIFDYMELIDSLDFQKYKVQWLKPKQATMLRLKGHRIESTTVDDKSTIGPVKLGT